MRPNSHCVAESSSLGSNPDSSTTDCNLEHIFHLILVVTEIGTVLGGHFEWF